MTAVWNWVAANWGVYFDNAAARRDYRAQLRGNRAVVLWAVYLFILISIAVFFYSETVSRGQMTIVYAQQQLQGFYQMVMGLLAGMVAMVAPALAATTVVAERERRSLDLVFSAPVKPKAYLVGKMISAYRYVWMLLVLALPVTSVCVVLGGATWGDVLSAYALLSLHGLLLSSFALLLSTLANKPVAAIIYSYIACFGYLLAVSIASAEPTFGPSSMRGSGEAPFFVTLSPFFVVQAASTFTSVDLPLLGLTQVPNLLFFVAYSLVLTRLFILGAASALSPYRSPETKNLRISGILTMGMLSALMAWIVLPQAPDAAGLDSASSILLVWSPLWMVFLLPFLSCYGVDGERKYLPDGAFSVRASIRGTPAGGLPYVLALVLATTLAIVLTAELATRFAVGELFLSSAVWAAGFWTFGWALGRYASSSSLELKAARTLHLVFMLLMLGLPVPLLTILDPNQNTFLWYLYPLYPLTVGPTEGAALRAGYGIGMAVLGVAIAFEAERRLKGKLAQRLAI